MLQRTLLLAQRAADDAVNEAQARAQADARGVRGQGAGVGQRRRGHRPPHRRGRAPPARSRAARPARPDASSSARRRRARGVRAGYRDRIRAAVEADLAQARQRRRSSRRRTRPELHEVEIPVEREPAPTAAVAAVVESAPAPEVDLTADSRPRRPRRASTAGDDATGLRPPPAPSAASTSGPETGPFAAEASRRRSPVAAPPRPEPAEWPPAPSPSTPRAAPRVAPDAVRGCRRPTPTGVVHVAWTRPRRGSASRTAEHAAAPAAAQSFATDVPRRRTPIDTDSLDDDAFFASLREAVRDDAPLGPRDEDAGATFFDERRRARSAPALPPPPLAPRVPARPRTIFSAHRRRRRPSTSRRRVGVRRRVGTHVELDREHLAGDPVAVRVRGGLDDRPVGEDPHPDPVGDLEAGGLALVVEQRG